jgi:hypothetical protein
MRYVKNNFFDGDRQDSYDILTGAWVAKRGGIPPLTDTRPLVMRAVSLSLILSDRPTRREWGGGREWRERRRRES